MDDLLEQIEASYDAGHLYLALFCTLALPDICGAISSPDGVTTGVRYREWFDKHVAPKYQGIFDGSNCYAFRCAVLHQGKAEHRNLGYERVVFLAPADRAQYFMHKNILNDALNLDLIEFCNDIVDGVRQWMRTASADPSYQKNMATFLKRHKGGLPKYVIGTDVYC